MYKIEKTAYGAQLTFDGSIKQDEMAQWVADSKAFTPRLPATFGVLVDMRTLIPLCKESQEEMRRGQKWYKKAGMQRSVVIVNSAVIKIQFKRIAQETGIYEWERYIDASATPNWEQVGIKWLVDGIDPD